MQWYPIRLFVLLVGSMCFLVTTGGRLLIDDDPTGLITHHRIFGPMHMPIFKQTVVQRHSPSTGSVELALTGNVGGSYDYPGDPAYNNNDDPVVTFNEVDDSDDDEYDDNGPIPRSVGKPITTFQPLCPFVRRTVELDPTIYRESSYTVIDCLHPYRPEGGSRHNKVCGGAGFSCIQRNRTIILVKRKHNQNCWETEARTINTGCDCMWPKHQMGDIEPYHG